MMSETRRQYLQTYRSENRDQYNAAHRRWRSSLYGKPATAHQRKICERNPLASLLPKFRVVRPGFVYCMLCWNPVGELGHHGCVKKVGGVDKYREQFHILADVPLWCEKFSKRKSRVSEKKCASHLRKFWKENPDALSGKAKPETWKVLPKTGAVSDGSLVWDWIVEQRPIEKVAAKNHMSIGAVSRRLTRILGLPSRRFCTVAHGDLVTKEWIARLLARFLLNVKELGDALGRNRNFADNLTRPSERRGVPRRAPAEAVVRFECELLRELLTAKNSSKPAVLRAIVPDLEEKYRALLEPCAWLLSHCEHPRDGVEYACQQSRSEVVKGETAHWRMFLCSLPGLIEFTKKQPTWKTKWSSASKLAVAFLGDDLGTEPWVLNAAMASGAEPVSRDALRLLVPAAIEKVKAKPGGSFGEDRRTQQRKKLAAAFWKLGWSQSDMAAKVFCDTPASAETNIWPFFDRHGRAIKVMASLNLTEANARKIVQNPKEFLESTFQ